jgi:hypothetical protein
MTSLSAVWVGEKPTTLLSTNPTFLVAFITSISLIVEALPLRETTQIAPSFLRYVLRDDIFF